MKNKKDLRKQIVKALEGKKKVKEIIYQSLHDYIECDEMKYNRDDDEAMEFYQDILDFMEENYEPYK